MKYIGLKSQLNPLSKIYQIKNLYTKHFENIPKFGINNSWQH